MKALCKLLDKGCFSPNIVLRVQDIKDFRAGHADDDVEEGGGEDNMAVDGELPSKNTDDDHDKTISKEKDRILCGLQIFLRWWKCSIHDRLHHSPAQSQIESLALLFDEGRRVEGFRDLDRLGWSMRSIL